MKEKRSFFSSTPEEIKKRARLFKYKIIVGVSVALLGVAWMKYQARARYNKQKENYKIASELKGEALNRFVEHATLFDEYYFNAQRLAPNGNKQTRELSAEVSKIDRANLLLIFKNGERNIDTLQMSKEKLIELSRNDTLKFSIDNAPYQLFGIKTYTRNDGPVFKSYSVSKTYITFIKKGGNAVITDIENIKGQTILRKELPYKLEEGKITFHIIRDNGIVDFIIKGKSDESENWSRRIVVNGWKAFTFIE
jgi:hypothetical protein